MTETTTTTTTIPAGWKLVPIEPTHEMMQAAYKTVGNALYDNPFTDTSKGWGERGADVYRAMLCAAPSPAPAALSAAQTDALADERGVSKLCMDLLKEMFDAKTMAAGYELLADFTEHAGLGTPVALQPAQGGSVSEAAECKARSEVNGGTCSPDCEWPLCDCDPHAVKVVAALEEMGNLAAPHQALESLTKTEIPPLDDAAFRKIMEDVGMPNSMSLYQALKHVQNWAMQFAEAHLSAARASAPAAQEATLTDDIVRTALQDAWADYCDDAGAYPDCFIRLPGGRLSADFSRCSNFIGSVRLALEAAMLGASERPAIHTTIVDGCAVHGNAPLSDESYQAVSAVIASARDRLKSTIDTRAPAASAAPEVAPILWCVHHRGPDDLHPVESYEAAVKLADQMNEMAERFNFGKPRDDIGYVMSISYPAVYPGTAEEHAAALRAAGEG